MSVRRKAYIETSVVSYLTARPTRDLVRTAHQQVTRDWWAKRGRFALFVSQVVLDEAAAGDADAAGRRLDALRDIELLAVTTGARVLADALVVGGGLPAKARVDALDVAIAAVHGMDFLLTWWNCAHIANASLRGRIEARCRDSGFEPRAICTPLELLKE